MSDLFIGIKIIKAEPMNKFEFLKKYKGVITGPSPPGTELDPGYHVVYPQPDGKEYHSWSPKEVFDNCHRKIMPYELDMIAKENR